MNHLFEPMEELEAKEEQLRQQVRELSQEQRQQFYNEQTKLLKDPDTYATLNWLFLGGIHHFYLKKYVHFAVEATVLLICLIGLIAGMPMFWIGIIAIAIYELPQLFFSQKIVRQYNYREARELISRITKMASSGNIS